MTFVGNFLLIRQITVFGIFGRKCVFPRSGPDPGKLRFPGSGPDRGKSTLSATMVGVVSTGTDPDFDEDLEILRKSGVPARKNLASWDPENRAFHTSIKPNFLARFPDFLGL